MRALAIYSEVVIGICWLGFFVAWIILALLYGGSRKRSGTAAAIGLRLSLLTGAYLAYRYGNSARWLGGLAEGASLVGALLCITGLAFAVWARATLGRSWAMPMALHGNPELVTSGPYRYVRHPIYAGFSAMLVGTSLAYPLAAAPFFFTIAYSVLAARREERDMERRFPGAYAEYRSRSKFLVPFVF